MSQQIIFKNNNGPSFGSTDSISATEVHRLDGYSIEGVDTYTAYFEVITIANKGGSTDAGAARRIYTYVVAPPRSPDLVTEGSLENFGAPLSNMYMDVDDATGEYFVEVVPINSNTITWLVYITGVIFTAT